MYRYRLYCQCRCISIHKTPRRDRVAPDRKYESSFSLISLFTVDGTDDREFSEAFEFSENIFSKLTMKYAVIFYNLIDSIYACIGESFFHF